MKLQAEALRVTLEGNEILRGVSIEANPGELVGVIGPNGSGKSTLLRCIYRVLRPTGGAVLLDGTPLEQLRPRQSAQKLAVVAQHNHYSFDFTVREVALMGRAPHKRALEGDTAEDYRIAEDALRRVGMWELRDRSFSTLSGGEQQRVVLARALVQQTPCLILDEPTNHLDIRYQLELMDIVRGLNRTVISAIHDLNIAAMYCTRLYVLRHGAVVASGAPAQVLTPELIRAVYEVDAEVYTDRGGCLRILYNPGGAASAP